MENIYKLLHMITSIRLTQKLAAILVEKEITVAITDC